MSVMQDVDIYKKMVSKEIVQKPCSIDENSTEFMALPSCDRMEETLRCSQVVGEEIVVHENMDINQQLSEENIDEYKGPSVYFEEDLETHEGMAVDYAESSAKLSTDNAAKEDWVQDNESHKHALMLSKVQGISGINVNRVSIDEQDGDEETIATFVTAAGQQLALYAVEDSDEIFAVAVYDESGEPPTNFQFLMKADVERLIGEGAVRTVKKPMQIKKQLFSTEPPVFYSKTEMLHDTQINNERKLESHENQRIQGGKLSPWNQNSNSMQDPDLNVDTKAVPNIVYTTDNKQSDITYLMMDECSVNVDNSEEYQEDSTGSENEFLEQSTVQYILFEGDQSDSELTFDEIQATLQNLKASESSKSVNLKKQTNKKTMRDLNNRGSIKQTDYVGMHQSSNYNVSSTRASSTLAERNFMESRRELLETLGDSTSDTISDNAKLDLSNGSVDCTSPESVQAQFKAKRSRKQQLISVNRDDSEIIIQPASLLNEEENTVRKRGKRKRRVAHSGYHPRNAESKRIKKMKRKEVEIIEIDVDEGESVLQGKRDVVEITIDDSKDKYSSDKENDIIMVGDSDDESQQQSDSKATLLQCQYCSRSFRQQRALESHLRVCSKSPSNAVRFNEQKFKQPNRAKEDTVKKQYACKICQTKFDVVVALARHVRSAHSQRKKRRYSKSSVEQELEESESESESKSESESEETHKPPVTMIKRIKRRKSQRPNNSWEVKKLSCTDCGRWFPSAALLAAHCLQHGTKKSEHQIRRCHICKKLIKSRLLFLRHLRKHSSAQQNTKPVANIQKKLHTTRSVTRKITTLRKRGRPRKL